MENNNIGNLENVGDIGQVFNLALSSNVVYLINL